MTAKVLFLVTRPAWVSFEFSIKCVGASRSFLPPLPFLHYALLRQTTRNPTQITSDASGTWGCGAFYNSFWFQFSWLQILQDLHITIKELLPIVMAAAIWGDHWQNKSVQCRCDNLAAVHIINSGTSSNAHAMALLRCLHFITAKFNNILSAVHLPGVDNELADALSRNNLAYFLSHNPQASPLPSLIPTPLVDLLTMDWTSPSWNSTFSSIFKQDYQRALSVPTSQPTTDTPLFVSSQEAADTPLHKTSYASSSVC